MATFQITAPNGDKYKVTGENAEGAYAALMQMLGEDAPAPEPQPEVSQGEDIKMALKSGLREGAIAVPEAIEMLGRLGVRTYQEAKDLLGYEVDEKTPVLQSTVGQALREAFPAEQYDPQTTAGEYAQTVAEFLPSAVVGGPAGIARRAVVAGTAGAGSEAAGQAAEEYAPSLETPARIIGAFAAPSVGLKAANKTTQALFKRSIERPTLENLQQVKNAAYAAVDKAGVKFKPNEMNQIVAKANAKVAEFNYVPEVDLQTKAALKTIQAQMDSTMTVGQLDKLRQGLYKRYNSARNEQGIREIIDVIDEAIEAKAPANRLMTTAREANKRYKKLELLEDAFKKAELDTAASGSGGNLVNNYRRAVKNILNSKKASRFFLDYELKMMEQFVRGNMSENTLRLIGKMSPSGGGLMQALNVGAIAYNPAMAGVSVAGLAAKTASEAKALKSAEQIKNMLATGLAPNKSISLQEIRALIGLEAGDQTGLLPQMQE
jgi:hypothetical protein|tara:strand:- start:14704 stop:16176 length:1473 start_codon:yes stop_codon:yes gene_type:complete